MSNLLLISYTYVGEVSPRSRGNDQDHSKAVHAKSQTARRHLKGASARAGHNCNAGRIKSVLAVLLQTKLPMRARTFSHFSGRAGAEKCSASWTRTQALNPKWHDGNRFRRVAKAKRGEQLTSYLETTQRRPPPSYDAHLPRCVMTFQ